MPGELAPVLVVVRPLREIGAAHWSIEERRQRAFERQDLQPVARELELADDLRAQQAHHVREDGEAKAGEYFLAHRRAAYALATLEHQHLAASAREVGGTGEPVVAAADDNDVVGLHAFFLCGSKKGFLATRALARLRRCSTVTSISSDVPCANHGARRCASAMYFFSNGDQPPLVA